jgi:RNA polymerase sigma-70 factor (ECF subfamily)
LPPATLESCSESQVPSAATSDEDLFQWIRQGSERHFNTLYDRYFQRIYHFIYLRVRNHADTEELTQETFTAVFRSIDAYSGRSTPLGWIYGIAKNTIHSHLRRLRAQRERMELAGPEMLAASSSACSCTPEDQLAMRRSALAIDARLQSVSDWQATLRSSDAVRSGLYRVKRLLVEAGKLDSATAGT